MIFHNLILEFTVSAVDRISETPGNRPRLEQRMKKESRRTFIKQGTIAVMAAPLISTSVTRALAQAAEKKIGFALCGLGNLSTNQIAPALQKTSHCRLAGI